MKTIEEIRDYLIQFAKEREWEQFHNPKNLSMALSVEVSELLEHFQWLSFDECKQLDDERKNKVAHEIADVQMYLILLANKLDINIIEAVRDKAVINEKHYPVSKVKGSAAKYSTYKAE